MNEIHSYKEIKKYTVNDFLIFCVSEHLLDNNIEHVYGRIYESWNGIYQEKIEILMFIFSFIVISGSWNPKLEFFLKKNIYDIFSEIDFKKEIKKINFHEACELIQDMQKVDIFEPYPGFYPVEYLSDEPRNYGVIDLPVYVKKDQAIGLWAVQADISVVFWVGCRDYGFSGWSYEQVCEWTYNQLKNRYAYKTERLMLKVSMLGLTSGWCPMLENILRNKIQKLLDTMNLEEELKDIDWNYDEEVEGALMIMMKDLRII